MYNLQQPQAPAPAPDISTDQLRQQIQQQVRQATIDARNAAKEASQAAREAQVNGQPVPPVGVPMIQMRGGNFERDMPPRVKDVSIAFFITLAFVIIGLPLVRAIARRVERGAPQPAQIPPQMQAQMEHLTQSIDAIAIEVERISEGQRFATKMLAEKKPEA